jgi:hypothetical protein
VSTRAQRPAGFQRAVSEGLIEAEINPLFVLQQGQRVCAPSTASLSSPPLVKFSMQRTCFG